MFKYSGLQYVNATLFADCKGYEGVLSINRADIFSYAQNLIHVSAPIFTGNLTGINFPIAGLFYNCYALDGDNVIAFSNLETTSLEELYCQCRFTSVSNEFATYAKANTTVVYANSIFRDNTYLETVPDEVLAFRNSTSFGYAFYGVFQIALQNSLNLCK